MSPILVRPVREQLEHDRVIRLLQAKYKRKFEVGINPGSEQTSPVGTGPSAWFPDVVLYSADRNRKLAGVVEVETTESVNNLEAMSQWAALSRFGVPFHLYLPTGSVDSGRRFCADLGLQVAEIWAYQSLGDQVRFTLVHRSAEAADSASPPVETPAEPRAAAPARRRPAEPAKAPAQRRRAAAPAAARSRPNGKAAARPARAAASTTSRRTAAKAKTAARRPAAKTARKAVKTTRASRAAKRR